MQDKIRVVVRPDYKRVIVISDEIKKAGDKLIAHLNAMIEASFCSCEECGDVPVCVLGDVVIRLCARCAYKQIRIVVTQGARPWI
jgi:hypothetical protein